MITESARNYHRQSVQIFTWFLGEITKGDIVVNNAPKNYSFEYPKPLTIASIFCPCRQSGQSATGYAAYPVTSFSSKSVSTSTPSTELIVPNIHDQDTQGDEPGRLEIRLHQPSPAFPLLLADLGVAVAGQVRQIDAVVDEKVVHLGGFAGGGPHPGKILPVQQAVDDGGLAHVGASGRERRTEIKKQDSPVKRIMPDTGEFFIALHPEASCHWQIQQYVTERSKLT